MFNKVLLVVSLMTLVSCASNQSASSTNLTKPKYKISDEDFKRWVLEIRKGEECLFPMQSKNRIKNGGGLLVLEPFDQYVYAKMMHIFLKETIGENNVRVIENDRASSDYILSQVRRFYHTNPVKFDKQRCEWLKKEYDKAVNERTVLDKQLEKEQKARKAYYTSPQVQSHLAHQRQKEKYQQQLLAQQIAYQQQLQAERQRKGFKELEYTVNRGLESISNSMYQSAKLINSTNNSTPIYQFQPPQNSSTTCYRLGNNIVRCNHK